MVKSSKEVAIIKPLFSGIPIAPNFVVTIGTPCDIASNNLTRTPDPEEIGATKIPLVCRNNPKSETKPRCSIPFDKASFLEKDPANFNVKNGNWIFKFGNIFSFNVATASILGCQFIAPIKNKSFLV